MGKISEQEKRILEITTPCSVYDVITKQCVGTFKRMTDAVRTLKLGGCITSIISKKTKKGEWRTSRSKALGKRVYILKNA